MYLGLDLGTSSLKALIIDDDQTVVAQTSQPITTLRPYPGWSEQDPADWIRASEAALDELAAKAGAALSSVSGIGLSGQMHGATLLDRSDAVLRPCVLWNDSRSADQAAALDADPRFRAVTGNIVFPGFTAPKIAWVRENEPHLIERLAKVLLPKDYLRFWLTGEHAADYADASGTGWLDTEHRRWSSELIEASGAPVDVAPRLVESTERSGALRPSLAKRWRMSPKTIVAGGAGDSAASAMGVGAVREGDAFISLGTSGIFLLSNESYRPMPSSAVHTFCHAAPGCWHQIGVILSAASSLSWFAGAQGASPGDLIAALGDDLRPPSATTFMPYLSGERTPHNDPTIRGAFIGLGHETDREDLTRAVLEGVAFAFRDNMDALRSAGADPKRILAIGGGARARYWMKVIATALETPVDVPKDHDVGAALGAARLGWIAAQNADVGAVCAPPVVDVSIEPDPALIDAFRAAHQRLRAAYAALRV